MNQTHSFPVVGDNGSRYWVAVNYEPKRKHLDIPFPWFGTCVFIGTIIMIVGNL